MKSEWRTSFLCTLTYALKVSLIEIQRPVRHYIRWFFIWRDQSVVLLHSWALATVFSSLARLR